MLNHAVELLDHGHNHVVQLIIPVLKALPSYECTVWKMDLPQRPHGKRRILVYLGFLACSRMAMYAYISES
jgi:hypothetical protein